jgi:hypothetical protein
MKFASGLERTFWTLLLGTEKLLLVIVSLGVIVNLVSLYVWGDHLSKERLALCVGFLFGYGITKYLHIRRRL